jgi:hypothetical protein
MMTRASSKKVAIQKKPGVLSRFANALSSGANPSARSKSPIQKTIIKNKESPVVARGSPVQRGPSGRDQ